MRGADRGRTCHDVLLALVRRVPKMLEEQAKRNWSRQDVSAKGDSVEGKVMAIVGYGQIGREIARRAQPFGITTIAVSRKRKSDPWLDQNLRCPNWTRCWRAPTS